MSSETARGHGAGPVGRPLAGLGTVLARRQAKAKTMSIRPEITGIRPESTGTIPNPNDDRTGPERSLLLAAQS
jgi:hypothetical protein